MPVQITAQDDGVTGTVNKDSRCCTSPLYQGLTGSLSPISDLPAGWVDSNVHWKLYGLSVRHKVQLAASHKQQQIPRDLWNIFINSLDDCTEGILSMPVGEHKQGSVPWSAGCPWGQPGEDGKMWWQEPLGSTKSSAVFFIKPWNGLDWKGP